MEITINSAGLRLLVHDLTHNDMRGRWAKLELFRYSQSDRWYVRLTRAQVRCLRTIADEDALTIRYTNAQL